MWGGHKKLLGCGLHGGISTEADTIDRGAGMQGYCRCCYVYMSWYRLFPPLVTACSPISYTRCLPPPLRCLWETLSVIHFLTIYSVFLVFQRVLQNLLGYPLIELDQYVFLSAFHAGCTSTWISACIFEKNLRQKKHYFKLPVFFLWQFTFYIMSNVCFIMLFILGMFFCSASLFFFLLLQWNFFIFT